MKCNSLILKPLFWGSRNITFRGEESIYSYTSDLYVSKPRLLSRYSRHLKTNWYGWE